MRVNGAGCVHIGIGGYSEELDGAALDVIWPAGYTAERLDDDTVVVKRPDGQVVAATGQEVQFGGGAVPLPSGIDMPCRAGSGDVAHVQSVLPPLEMG